MSLSVLRPCMQSMNHDNKPWIEYQRVEHNWLQATLRWAGRGCQCFHLTLSWAVARERLGKGRQVVWLCGDGWRCGKLYRIATLCLSTIRPETPCSSH